MSDKLQTNFEVIRLYDESSVLKQVIKVGIIPFLISRGYGGLACQTSELEQQGSERGTRAGTASPLIKMLFMKPRAEARHLGAPAFQIAKGTRRIYINERWCDMREDDLRYADESFYETVLDTALREGQEEVGLRLANIRRLFDMGDFTFTSASRGIIKPLRIFAAEVMDAGDFDSFEASTSEARWMTPEEFAAMGRADHVKIMDEVGARLKLI